MKTRHYLTPSDIEKIRHMIEVECLQQWKVADEIGVSQGAIEKVVKKLGLSTQRTGPRSGDGHTNWNGGVIVRKGYRYVYLPTHPNSVFGKRYVAEHRLVMEKILGRYLTRKEVVHHIDGDQSNNAPQNLMMFPENKVHLMHELTGHVPNWTPEGRKRMGNRRHKVSGDGQPPQPIVHPPTQSDSTGEAPAS